MPTVHGSFKGLSLAPEMLKRISAGALIVGSLLLVVWSVMFRLSLVTEAQSKIHTPFSLSRQVDSLQQLWSDEDANSIETEWANLKTQSFENYDDLMLWVVSMTVQAQTLGLDVNYRIDDASAPVQGVQEIHRIGMEWTIQAAKPGEGYPHFMQFVKALSDHDVKVNFELMELTGLGNGAQKMELRLSTFLQQGP